MTTDEIRRPELAEKCRKFLVIEILLVMFLSLGKSAVYAILNIWNRLTAGPSLRDQKAVINSAYTPNRPLLDFAYQMAGIVFPLVPVGLALYLLYLTNDRNRIGFDLRRPKFDIGWGIVAALSIGIPGLLFYYASRWLGINANVEPATMHITVVAVVVLIASAAMNAILEETIMLGFLGVRLQQIGFGVWGFILTSALIRGSYHLYQGFGGAIGNFVMGVVFGWLYLRFKRVMPLVVAHFLLDFVAFVGYLFLAPYLPKF